METLLPAVRSGFRIPAGMNFSHLQTVQTLIGAHAVSCEMHSGRSFAGSLEAGAWSPSVAEIKNKWSSVSSPLIRLHSAAQEQLCLLLVRSASKENRAGLTNVRYACPKWRAESFPWHAAITAVPIVVDSFTRPVSLYCEECVYIYTYLTS
jgi:hypothetical protein